MAQRSEQYQWLLLLVLVFVAAAGAALWYTRNSTSEPLVVSMPTPHSTASSVVPRTVKVYVTGAVLRPGVYSLAEGSRVEEAVAAAGGFDLEADRNTINLAALVKDGQHLQVTTLRQGLSSTSGGSTAVSAKVNVNTASAAALAELPTIGEVTANKIVSYRESHGPFTRIEDLRDHDLLRRQSDFDQIKDLIATE